MTDWQSLYIEAHRNNVHHFQRLLHIVRESGEPLEGNCFGSGDDVGSVPSIWLPKQANFFHACSDAKHVMEIGTNSGYSALIFLLANPSSTLTLFDLGEHAYTRPCVEYLQSVFPDRITAYYGDSLQAVPEFHASHPEARFDVIHIDGGHHETQVRGDIANCHKVAAPGNVVFSDDDNQYHIYRINREMTEKGVWKPVAGYYETYDAPHYVASYVV
jgi:hypothetical protein